jgi:hypothetical protein
MKKLNKAIWIYTPLIIVWNLILLGYITPLLISVPSTMLFLVNCLLWSSTVYLEILFVYVMLNKGK